MVYHKGFTSLGKNLQVPEEVQPEKFFRKTSRRYQTIQLGLEIFSPEPGRQPIMVRGFSSDISLGGTCVIIDPKYRSILVDDIMDRKVMIRISLPDEAISVLIIGNIVWVKDAEINRQETCALGIKFNETPPRVRAAMIFFVTALSSLNKDGADYNLSQDEIETW